MLIRHLLLLSLLLPLLAQGAITHQETASNDGAIVSSGTLTVTMAGAATDGELLLAYCHRDAGGGNTGATGFPAGFTKLTAISVSTTDQRDRVSDVGYKIASSEGTTYTFTNNEAVTLDMHCIVMVYSGVNSTQMDVTPTSSHYVFTVNTDAPDPPSITTATDGAMVVIFASTSGLDNSRFCTAPSGYTLRHGSVDLQDEAFVCAAEKLITTAGAENPGAWAITNGNGCGTECTDDTYAATVAIAPESASSLLLFER